MRLMADAVTETPSPSPSWPISLGWSRRLIAALIIPMQRPGQDAFGHAGKVFGFAMAVAMTFIRRALAQCSASGGHDRLPD